jgi:hypothetical protein
MNIYCSYGALRSEVEGVHSTRRWKDTCFFFVAHEVGGAVSGIMLCTDTTLEKVIAYSSETHTRCKIRLPEGR